MEKKTMLVAGMLLVSLVPFCAAAQGQGPLGGGRAVLNDKFDEANLAWNEMKGKVNDSAGEVRERALERAQNYLLAAADRIINNAENLKSRVENTVALGDDEKDGILATLEGFVDYFESVKPEIEGAENITQLRATSQEMREEWRQFRAEVRVISGDIWAARVDGAIVQAENASIKVREKIDALAALNSSPDTSAIEGTLADYGSLVSEAQDLNDGAQAKFAEITDLESAQQKAPEGRQLIKDASDKLKEARQVLKQIIKDLKALKTR
jgi:hypothetical protein